jgi:hypothetical protein
MITLHVRHHLGPPPINKLVCWCNALTQIVAYLTHWVACGFEGMARGAGYDPDYLVGMNPALFQGANIGGKYLYSLYWSVTTLAGNEWNGGWGGGGVMGGDPDLNPTQFNPGPTLAPPPPLLQAWMR